MERIKEARAIPSDLPAYRFNPKIMTHYERAWLTAQFVNRNRDERDTLYAQGLQHQFGLSSDSALKAATLLRQSNQARVFKRRPLLRHNQILSEGSGLHFDAEAVTDQTLAGIVTASVALELGKQRIMVEAQGGVYTASHLQEEYKTRAVLALSQTWGRMLNIDPGVLQPPMETRFDGFQHIAVIKGSEIVDLSDTRWNLVFTGVESYYHQLSAVIGASVG